MNAPVETPVKQRPQYAPGWYKNLSNEEYHGSAGTSSSQLKMLLEKTPAHLRYSMSHPKETAAAMALGTAVHTLTLEPEKFDAEVAVAPQVDKRTNVGKAAWADFVANSDGKTIITPAQYEQAQRMADSVRNHPIAGVLVEDAIVESSIYWWYKSMDPDEDTRFKEMVKVRPDGLCRSHPIIFDLKSTTDASFSSFAKTIHSFGYHVSAAMYKEGVNQCKPLLEELRHFAYTNFVFIVVESEAPYLCALYEIDQEAMDIGKAMYRHAMRQLKYAHENNWPAFPEDIRMISLPGWANRAHVV